ncbi:hypothetical protein BT93_F1685 [Corymbia citriodora subsp. variegata]|nr:hypothetical protein BT93_F1685 [Corymbia citriodora subsp. variegata]
MWPTKKRGTKKVWPTKKRGTKVYTEVKDLSRKLAFLTWRKKWNLKNAVFWMTSPHFLRTSNLPHIKKFTPEFDSRRKELSILSFRDPHTGGTQFRRLLLPLVADPVFGL